MKKRQSAAPRVVNITETASGTLHISYPPLQKKYDALVKWLRAKLQMAVASGDRIFTLDCDSNNPKFFPAPHDEMKIIRHAANEASKNLPVVFIINIV